jgi:hypothetical protein
LHACGYLLQVGVPSFKNACFRQMAGVVTNEDSECVFLSKWPAWSPTKTYAF